MWASTYALWLEAQGLRTGETTSSPGRRSPCPSRTHVWTCRELPTATWTAEASIAAIERARRRRQPFFLWTSFHDPHSALSPLPSHGLPLHPCEMEPGSLFPGELDRMPPHFARRRRCIRTFSPWREIGVGNTDSIVTLSATARSVRIWRSIDGMNLFMDAQNRRILDRAGCARPCG